MNEEIEYAEMLEIPVSTVNVVKKRRRHKQKAAPIQPPTYHGEPLKDSVIAQVNDRMNENEPLTLDPKLLAESANSGGHIDFDIPERIDTVRVYSTDRPSFWRRHKKLEPQEFPLEEDSLLETEEFQTEELPELSHTRKESLALKIEFGAVCALCGVIFLTNALMPTSAINTFFRTLNGTPASAKDNRKYSDFTLSAVVSEFSSAELNLSPTGILTFTGEGCVYPVADGKVSAVTRSMDGKYQVKISHSDLFTGVIEGLDYVYYEMGDSVKGNVPVGYTLGEDKVQVTMYDEGELLNCFEITDENCLAWLEK